MRETFQGWYARQEDKCDEIRSDIAADTGILDWLVDFYQHMQKNVLKMEKCGIPGVLKHGVPLG